MRHTIDRIGVNRSDWPKSMDRQRARSIPRKIHFNRDSIGFLDTSIDPISHGISPASNALHRHSSRDPLSRDPLSRDPLSRDPLVFDPGCRGCLTQTVHTHAHDHFLPSTNGPNGPVPSSGPVGPSRLPLSYHHRFSKENPNIFDRLREAQFSDYSESGSLSSLSSWDRTRVQKRGSGPQKRGSGLAKKSFGLEKRSSVLEKRSAVLGQVSKRALSLPAQQLKEV